MMLTTHHTITCFIAVIALLSSISLPAAPVIDLHTNTCSFVERDEPLKTRDFAVCPGAIHPDNATNTAIGYIQLIEPADVSGAVPAPRVGFTHESSDLRCRLIGRDGTLYISDNFQSSMFQAPSGENTYRIFCKEAVPIPEGSRAVRARY